MTEQELIAKLDSILNKLLWNWTHTVDILVRGKTVETTISEIKESLPELAREAGYVSQKWSDDTLCQWLFNTEEGREALQDRGYVKLADIVDLLRNLRMCATNPEAFKKIYPDFNEYPLAGMIGIVEITNYLSKQAGGK